MKSSGRSALGVRNIGSTFSIRRAPLFLRPALPERPRTVSRVEIQGVEAGGTGAEVLVEAEEVGPDPAGLLPADDGGTGVSEEGPIRERGAMREAAGAARFDGGMVFDNTKKAPGLLPAPNGRGGSGDGDGPGGGGEDGSGGGLPSRLAVLTLERVLFPKQMIYTSAADPQEARLLREASRGPEGGYLLAATKSAQPDATGNGHFRIATVARVFPAQSKPEGRPAYVLQGIREARISRYDREGEAWAARLEYAQTVSEPENERRELGKAQAALGQLFRHHEPEDYATAQAAVSVSDPEEALGLIMDTGLFSTADQQHLLTLPSLAVRLNHVTLWLAEMLTKMHVTARLMETRRGEDEPKKGADGEVDAGAADEYRKELDELGRRIRNSGMSPEAQEKAGKELRKLRMMNPMSAEAVVSRNYIDWLVSVPWRDDVPEAPKEEAKRQGALRRAQDVLEEDHYGLKPVKEKILEHMAVRMLNPKGRAPILCLVGPPGVGKTSLGKSIARATGRKFVRISLGGVRDEAEIRGHRRTYIGALPGKIMSAMKKAGTKNLVFMLDEIDKLSADYKGDPADAFLEVLDPEQNFAFNDHYLDVDYDLSKVLFVATANYEEKIPKPLLDRMDVIRLAGYTELEKLSIARKYLVPKQGEEKGLARRAIEFLDDAVLGIVREYTREPGVRGLERAIGDVYAKIARRIGFGEGAPSRIAGEDLPKYLGRPGHRRGERPPNGVGFATGLAWTGVGGEVLPVEVGAPKGRGRLTLTGKLGEVMQESAKAALTWAKEHAEAYGIDPAQFETRDFHIHVPEGAIPKDGPSAGVTIAAALMSKLTGRAVRADLAMTGEITLSGRVTAIGGLKEKSLAAHREGVKTILMPKQNEDDLEDIPEEIRGAVRFEPVATLAEVMERALMPAVPAAKAEKRSPEPEGSL